MKWLKTLVLILAMLLLGVGAALSQNQQEIHLAFAIWKTPFPLSVFWWLLAAFVIGVSFAVLTGLWASTKRRLELRKLRRELAQATAEIERLRDVTLQG
ncbi:MAG: putative integral membrane protein [Limisphaerales bacterium]|jgi:uncharacterized integral membrane protein